MSHHIHMLLPQLLPLEGPLKPDKKRRLRELRAGQLSSVDEADETDEIDGVFAMTPAHARSGASDVEEDDKDPVGQPAGRTITGATLKALLQAQEDR
jgi:hypothetical protein